MASPPPTSPVGPSRGQRRRPPPLPAEPASFGQPSLGMRIGRASWVAGLALALSSFMGWYAGAAEEGPRVAVLGWNTGTPGKLVFFAGVAVICLALLRGLGVEPPRLLPESLLVVSLGTLSTALVLFRVISIPDSLVGTGDRAAGLWVALVSALAVIVCGLLRAGEEL